MPAADLAALIATLLAVVGVLPQLHRLARTNDVNGVSLAYATVGVGSELGWLTYTVQGSLWSAVPESAILAATNVLLAVFLIRTGIPFARPLAVAMIWCAAMVVGGLLGGWAMLGTLLPIAYGAQVAPAIWAAYRSWAPSGIAVATWNLILVECVLWGFYGATRGDHALTMLGAIGCGASVAIIVRVLLTRGRVLAVRQAGLATAPAERSPAAA